MSEKKYTEVKQPAKIEYEIDKYGVVSIMKKKYFIKE
jgi:hypothetical protein